MPKKPFTSLAESHPEVASEAFGWDPNLISHGISMGLPWKCELGHIYKASPNSRTRPKNTGCPYCSNRRVLKGFNDLATTYPSLANEADGWDSSLFSAGMANVMPWKCSKGHQWTAAIYSRARNNRGCPYCSNQKVLIGFNDLATTNPKLAKEAFEWDPRTVISGSAKPLKWKCSKNHIFKATINNRNRKGEIGTDCPFCANTKVLAGFNDIATTNRELLPLIDGWDPTKFTAHSDKRMSWKCSSGHTWKSQIKNLSLGTRCPTCSKYGFDPNENGYLYFLEHQKLQMFQIGITNVPSIRLPIHFRRGWELIEIRGPMDGLLAKNWETSILRMLKSKGADLSNSKIAGKFDGYSEAWSQNKFQVESIKQLMELTEKFEDN